MLGRGVGSGENGWGGSVESCGVNRMHQLRELDRFPLPCVWVGSQHHAAASFAFHAPRRRTIQGDGRRRPAPGPHNEPGPSPAPTTGSASPPEADGGVRCLQLRSCLRRRGPPCLPSKSDEEAPASAAKEKQRPLPSWPPPPRAAASQPPHGRRTPPPGRQCPCVVQRAAIDLRPSTCAAPHARGAPRPESCAPRRFLRPPTHEHHAGHASPAERPDARTRAFAT